MFRNHNTVSLKLFFCQCCHLQELCLGVQCATFYRPLSKLQTNVSIVFLSQTITFAYANRLACWAMVALDPKQHRNTDAGITWLIKFCTNLWISLKRKGGAHQIAFYSEIHGNFFREAYWMSCWDNMTHQVLLKLVGSMPAGRDALKAKWKKKK